VPEGEGVQEVPHQAESAGATAVGEVEDGDERQRKDLRERGNELGNSCGRDDLGPLGSVDEQDRGGSAASDGADAVERCGAVMGHGRSPIWWMREGPAKCRRQSW